MAAAGGPASGTAPAPAATLETTPEAPPTTASAATPAMNLPKMVDSSPTGAPGLNRESSG
jgi:hypothetical protein